MAKFEFAGFSLVSALSEISEEFKFEEVMENCYATPKFSHREEGLNFDYHYYVEVIDGEELGAESSLLIVSLVPTFDSLCKEKQDSVSYGCDECTSVFDVASYGFSTPIESFYLADKGFSNDYEGVQNALNEISRILPTLDSMRGLILDKPINAIGSTGWDEVYSWLEDGKNFTEYALERYHQEKGE